MNTPERFDEGYNIAHRPSAKLENVILAPNMLLVWRPGTPKERHLDASQIVRPDGTLVKYKYEPNCALVVKAGDGCKYKPGMYVFWVSDGRDNRKPNRIVFDFTDQNVYLFTLDESQVIMATAEEGYESDSKDVKPGPYAAEKNAAEDDVIDDEAQEELEEPDREPE